ncbi:MAG: nickel pincer cofactor biosynthesis protein LarC [Hydrococcus sp. C42_A2020_068]|uniref:nickel pincer cofactor biosynthesis protein LarC n=1 Tax=Pleurocapsa sp. PCC 7327 TaxID=118163 RepID=UPI00029FC4F9|nr:nickel pincer cofactor biosynthesis protein LarC [Pleurocapsa sp. PCC 7327]AFY77350.1 TIGR00299 family protein [Pleurocapsa sp. PCC 7327]MBF2020625.1 nickel pincer cofactor biosynthesis protein LarC [Hydrococcus sp. C42_A2020_068]
MKKLAYLECQTGIAGDMCLGALVDAGVPLEYLSEQLKKLGIEREYSLWAEKVRRNGQVATKVHVDVYAEPSDSHKHYNHERHHDHRHRARHLPEIEQLIQAASLPPRAAEWSLKVFRQLAIAEGAVHGIAPQKVHFHEVGATDAIVDIVGTCLGLDWLGIDELHCSAMPTGGGTVKAAHGILPVPVPAVMRLWEARQVPVYSNGIDKELVTPTGAAIAATLATHFGAPPAMSLERIGLGAGSRDLPIPNILRLWLGRSLGTLSTNQETISVLETQIDDLSPQAIGYVFEELFKVGALDVFTVAIGMKKSRPGILLTVICHPEKVSACEAVLFRETTTLGIRHLTQQRSILQREIHEVKTIFGTVRIKVATQGTEPEKTILNVQPEYEDCAELARNSNQPWHVIHQMALAAWYGQNDAR